MTALLVCQPVINFCDQDKIFNVTVKLIRTIIEVLVRPIINESGAL
jgi:hypothetical protein